MNRLRLVPIVFIALTLFLYVSSCRQSHVETSTPTEIDALIGKSIDFDIIRSMQLIHEAKTDVHSKKHITIINYVDSSDCVPCRLRLDRWNSYIRSLDSIIPSTPDIGLIVIVEPKDLDLIKRKITQSNFEFPIYSDSTGVFRRMIELPSDNRMHTFLIKDEEIIGVGNPVMNPHISDYYIKLLSELETR